MSFGFGFALPAYPLRGGGGNNPFNQLGPTLDLSFVDGATNVGDQLGPDTYTLNTDFITPEYQVAAQYAIWENGVGLAQKTFSQIVTFTRASTATYFNSTGTLTTAAINEARFDYNPSTLAARGLLIEEARTNSIRNNTMQGAVAGTPGTFPTNWTISGSGLGTLTREVVGTGVVNGITYIDLRISGTTSTTGLNYAFEPVSGGIAASSGQTWTSSVYVALVGGSLSNINQISGAAANGRSSGGTGTTDNFTSGDNKAALTSTLQRFSATGTLADAATVTLQPYTRVTFSSGLVIDITLRIGLPQLELGAFATSVIPTTTTALTRSADLASVNTLSPWFNATEGTIYAEATARLGFTQGFAVFEGTAGAGMRVRKNSLNQYSGVLREPTNRDISLTPSPALTEGQIIREALAIKANDCALSGGGQSPATQTTFTIPTVTAFAIGGSIGAGEPFANSWIRRITYYPRRLPNADLQTITT